MHTEVLLEDTDGPWWVAELIDDRIYLRLAVDRQIGAHGQVLPDQSVDVRATAALPRAVRVTEIHLHARVRCQLRVPGHLRRASRYLSPLSCSQRLNIFAARGRGDDGVAFRVERDCRDVRPFGRAALDQQVDGKSVASALDEVNLPVLGKSPIIGSSRAHMDAQHFGQRSPAVFAPRAWHTFALCTAQTGNQVFTQLAFGLGVDAVVGGLVRVCALWVSGSHALECARSLRGRTLLSQKVQHDAKKQGVHRQLVAASVFEGLPTGSHTGGSGVESAIRLKHERRAVLPKGKLLEFGVDGGRRTVKGARDVARGAFLVPQYHVVAHFSGVSCS